MSVWRHLAHPNGMTVSLLVTATGLSAEQVRAELRALGSWLYEQQGFSTEYVQALLCHATPEMTAYYQDGHEQKEVIYQHVQAGLKL